jgi:hypothetical protein
MARPTRQTLDSQLQAWDAVVNANFQILMDAPTPIFQVANESTLTSSYSASQYEDCVAITADTHHIYVSNGTAWVQRSATQLHYSTSEQDTGIDWLAGSNPRIYQKTILLDDFPDTTTKTWAHGITNLDRIVKHECWTTNTSNNNKNPVPLQAIAVADIQLQVDNSDVIVITENDRTDTSAYITLYYTKTA